MKSMTPRQHKVANLVQHAVALALVQGRIPSTLPLTRVTVLDCWMSADLRIARLFLQVPSDLNNPDFFKEANAQLAKPMRKIVSTSVSTKYTPDIVFFPAEDATSYPTAQPKA